MFARYSALSYRSRVSILLTIFLLCAFWAVAARAQAPPFLIQRDGVIQFGANFLQHDAGSPTYNFCETAALCGGVTPPPPDPGAYTTAVVTWLANHVAYPAQTNVTQFFNLFGRVRPTLPVQPWPGANGATISYLDNSPKYMRLHVDMVANPGTLSHFLKAVSYGASPGLHAKFAVVATGAPWPTGPDTQCWKHDQIFMDQVALNLNPGPPNSAKCSVGASYDVLVDALTSGTIALSFN